MGNARGEGLIWGLLDLNWGFSVIWRRGSKWPGGRRFNEPRTVEFNAFSVLEFCLLPIAYCLLPTSHKSPHLSHPEQPAYLSPIHSS